jgi:hypothetical protein
MLLLQLFVPRCRSDEQGRVGLGAKEVVQELQRLAVGPLQIVRDEEDGRAGHEDGVDERVEEPLPLLALRQPRRRRKIELTRELGEETSEL